MLIITKWNRLFLYFGEHNVHVENIDIRSRSDLNSKFLRACVPYLASANNILLWLGMHRMVILHVHICSTVWMSCLGVANGAPKGSVEIFFLIFSYWINHYFYFINLCDVIPNKYRSFCVCICMYGMVELSS